MKNDGELLCWIKGQWFKLDSI